MNLSRRGFVEGCAGSLAASLRGGVADGGPENTVKPNIVFILIDDLGWRDLVCYGSSFYETPNLDRLRSEGMAFTDAYAACPVCSPTRASIMTGRYPARVGVTDYIGGQSRGKLISAPYIDHLPLTEKSLARSLKEGGYATWHVGKWHLGGEQYTPEHHGFDVNVGGGAYGNPPVGYFSPWRLPNLEDGPPGAYLTDRLTDEAIRLIEGAGDRPFYLNFCHYAVHTPIQAPEPLVAKYRAKAAAMGLDAAETFRDGDFFPQEAKKNQRIRRRLLQSDPVYAAMVENLDANIGRLLAAIHDSGREKNTIVIFTSDNGGLATSEGSPTCNHPLAEGKGWMYEGGTREPLIVRWPGVTQPGSVCDVPVTSPDFYPTLLEAAGLPPNPRQHVDGKSIVPLLRGETEHPHDAIFWHYPHYGNQGGTPGCSVRMGDWKLIEFFEDDHAELYNLRTDLSETKDLAAAEPRRVAAMRRRLAAWRRSVHARIPQPNPDFVPWR